MAYVVMATGLQTFWRTAHEVHNYIGHNYIGHNYI